MGFLPSPLSLQPHEEPAIPNHLHLDSSSSSISSQSSLASVPSLNSVSKEIPTIHHHCISTLKGHPSYVFSLVLSGKYLYSGSSNGELCMWSRSPSNHEDSAENVVFSCKSAVKSLVILGDKLFSGHQDHKIRVWKIEDATAYKKHKCIAILPTLNDRVTRLFLAKNYVQIRRHKKCTWVHHVDTISALALSKDGSFIYSASWDRTFKVWRTSDFKCLESVWNAHDDAINAIVSSSDGFVYTGSADRKIKVWRKKEADKKHILVGVLEKHKSAVNALALSTDGSVLYSGACDRSIIVWEKTSSDGNMVVAGALRGHTNAILCLAVVSDLVCSGSADKTVRIWRKEFGKSHSCLAVLEGHKRPVKCLTATVDSCSATHCSATGIPYLVCSGSLDCDVKVWQIWVPFL
ncbi:putative U3 small nucleolar RNA-associated protein 13 [Heracleum sosnowskyi]|uniref:U3 small nucleolar RNA-associated protein 13 n=1 Tax=Heracleum sosnowskyi TaxID=360622 RepID=A0AAD8IAE3_9APIA|nr:putative U3 small nucleolar RNA-associated protein 13 [Heracleum sosnowskyi]